MPFVNLEDFISPCRTGSAPERGRHHGEFSLLFPRSLQQHPYRHFSIEQQAKPMEGRGGPWTKGAVHEAICRTIIPRLAPGRQGKQASWAGCSDILPWPLEQTPNLHISFHPAAESENVPRPRFDSNGSGELPCRHCTAAFG